MPKTPRKLEYANKVSFLIFEISILSPSRVTSGQNIRREHIPFLYHPLSLRAFRAGLAIVTAKQAVETFPDEPSLFVVTR